MMFPMNVATLSSRVTFSVDGRRRRYAHPLARPHDTRQPGLFLPITTPRALALLGLAEGQDFRLDGPRRAAETELCS